MTTEPFIQFTDYFMDKIKETNPAIETQEDAALYMKNQMAYHHASRPENRQYNIWVMSHSTTPEGRDYYELVGNFEHLDNEPLVRSIIPALSEWFQAKYKDNKDAYLLIDNTGKVDFMMYDDPDIDFEPIHKESIE